MRRPQRPERIVRMRDRRAEKGVHRVADVFLHDAALGDDPGADLGERGVQRAFQPFRTETDREVGRPNDIDEDTRHQAALFAGLTHRGSVSVLARVMLLARTEGLGERGRHTGQMMGRGTLPRDRGGCRYWRPILTRA